MFSRGVSMSFLKSRAGLLLRDSESAGVPVLSFRFEVVTRV